MQVAPVAMPHADAVRTAITPIAAPFKAQITAVEDVAADELTTRPLAAVEVSVRRFIVAWRRLDLRGDGGRHR